MIGAANDGSLFVEFYWSKPGEDPELVFPKLGTAMMVPGTEIWIGTGAYIDDVEKKMSQNDAELAETISVFRQRLIIIFGAGFSDYHRLYYYPNNFNNETDN